MSSLDRLKESIDLHELAERLGWERPHARGNYRSPHHPDKNPSISIFEGGTRFKDFSSGAAGTCIDAVMFHFGIEFEEAEDWLRTTYGQPKPTRAPAAQSERESLAEYIARQSMENPAPAIKYLVEQRGIPEATAARAVALKAVGWNDYCNPKVKAGDFGHGGPALACIVRSVNPGRVTAVELRYADEKLNGGVKTQTQGQKHGAPFLMDPRALQKAKRVIVCESPINALSVEACGMKGTVALATRGTQTLHAIDFSILRGKEVLIAMDPDAPIAEGPMKGRSPGTEAAWALYDILTALNISAMIVDQDDWKDGEDLNDVLRGGGVKELTGRLGRLSQWAIPGQPGNLDQRRGRNRVFLPANDWAIYHSYKVMPDFTRKVTVDQEGRDKWEDVAGFRIAALTRLTIQSAPATLTGCADQSPLVLFACAVQTGRHGKKLIRKVMTDKQVHNIGFWEEFSSVYNARMFKRLINIWERAADIGAIHAVNLVGLAWKDGKLTVSEGPDCYFQVPHQQCPYHRLSFPRGTREDARRIIHAYARTMSDCAALQVLVWGLGAHIKAFTEFWPHMNMQARKGAGKTTLARRLERTLAMKVFGGETTGSRFRMLCSISGTFHPVGWEEVSAHGQGMINAAESLLQDSYQSNVSQRNSDLVEFLITAPVLLVGEDVPMDSVIGKTVRTYLNRQGDMIPSDMAAFPVREWLDFLAGKTKEQVRQTYGMAKGYLESNCMANHKKDPGARRMLENYAAVATAWYLLCEFSEIDHESHDFLRCLVGSMNVHIKETEAQREPWVWVTETILSQMASGNFHHPYTVDCLTDSEMCLVIRPSHMIDHIKTTPGLRGIWDGLPVKSAVVFKRQLEEAGIIEKDGVERKIRGKRYGHLTALSVERLEKFGLMVPEESVDNNN